MNELIRDSITPFFDKLLRKIDTLEDRITNLDKKISHLDTVISNISDSGVQANIISEKIKIINGNDYKHS